MERLWQDSDWNDYTEEEYNTWQEIVFRKEEEFFEYLNSRNEGLDNEE